MKVRQELSLRDRCPEIYEIPHNQYPETKIRYLSDNNTLNLFQMLNEHAIIIKLAISKDCFNFNLRSSSQSKNNQPTIRHQLINTVSSLFKGIYFEITSCLLRNRIDVT